ncbi:hypothetical protein HNQ59_001600 [Chitinivorax tropicus]|uniref:DegT/DnrJ/EryC1/StrS aminotransferase family protein n=1 Tax=Chitinivorax tropicus TaxID=714531 RepID=A0A840MNI7_9PROT|nr:DegT/DnrJ/EryC1/StrS family aminotransferase [Chitinivorax tropicus]MBB5018312.1 hypothetical protein [Chitinivorax tropicus]
MTALADCHVEFIRLDPFRDYPSPKVSVLPVFDPALIRHRLPAGPFFSDQAVFLNAGRTALEWIARHLPRPGAILLPAFHCPTMVTPVHAAGRQARFYRLQPDLQPDLADLEQTLQGGDIAAVLVPHYFGFPQPALPTLASRIKAANAYLIEDCAHALLSEQNGQPLGQTGDYAIASTRKFVPGRDGGLLLINHAPESPVDLPRPGMGAELRSVYDLLQQSAQHGHLPILKWLVRPPSLQAIGNSAQTLPPQRIQVDARQGLPRQRGLHSSRWVLRHTDYPALISRRRSIYKQWLHIVNDIPGVRPLFPALPDGVVPYMFPLLLDEPKRYFPALKQARLPIWRWDELAESSCEVSQRYGIGLLQLPCHQSIRHDELDWMATQLSQIMHSNKGLS